MFLSHVLISYFLLNLPLIKTAQICTKCACVHGKSADTPIWIDIGKRKEIAVTGPSCGGSMTYTWKAVNGKGELIYDLGATSKPRVLWLPFKAAVRLGHTGSNNRIIVTKTNGLNKGYCECHIDFVLPKIVANIEGSQLMHIGHKQNLQLRGGHLVYDYAQPSYRQKHSYRWECEPLKNDMQSGYCKKGKLLSVQPNLLVQGARLKLNGEYKITFTAKSPVTSLEGNASVQMNVVYDKQIPLVLYCYRNCMQNNFNPGIAMHVQIACVGSCGVTPKFHFFIDGVEKTSNDHGHFRFMPPDDITKFELRIRLLSSNIVTEGICYYYRNEPPVAGTCGITPEQGVPGDTLFRVECHNWQDKQKPLGYELKAEHLVYDQTSDPHWQIYVPEVTELTIIVCDALKACTKTNVPIKLAPVDIPKGLEQIKEYMKKDGNNIRALLRGGEYARAVIKAILMMKNQTIETDKHIMAQFHEFQPELLVDVLQMGAMTNQLLSALGEQLTSVEIEAFLELLDKMCAGFERTIATKEIEDIATEDLRELSEEVIELVSKFIRHAENFSAPQTQLWEYEGGMVQVEQARANLPPGEARLVEYYGEFAAALNDSVLKPINIWMHALCKTFQLIHYLGVASSFRVHKDDENFTIKTDLVEMQTFGVDENANLTIVSPDTYATAQLTVDMLVNMQKKLGGKDMTAQVVSFKDNPFWWFPTEHPITTPVFYFSSFSETDLHISDTQLDVPLHFELQQHERNKAIPLISGVLYDRNEMPIYRVRTPVGAAVIVNITTAEVDMDILVQCSEHMPNLRQVRTRGQRVRTAKPNDGTQYTDTNDRRRGGGGGGGSGRLVGDEDWCYVALIASEHAQIESSDGAKYAFTVEMYECLTWNVDLNNPTWRTEGCVAKHVDANITCLCYHMSIFAGRSYYSSADEVVRERLVEQRIRVNGYLVAFFIFIILLSLWLLLRAYDDMQHGDEKLLSELSENEREKVCNIALHIATGGQWTAECTANILVTLADGRSYKITQDPEKPLLKPNTTCVLQLPLRANELTAPIKIQLSHDGSGRYPSWYCESITILNLESGEQHYCTVGKWIGTRPIEVQPDVEEEQFEKEKQEKGRKKKKAEAETETVEASESAIATTSKQITRQKPNRCQKVLSAIRDHFICWFLFQPLFGPRHHGYVGVQRFVRTCIWLAKFVFIILLVFLYFGKTTLDNYEAERYKYDFIIKLVNWQLFLHLFVCYLITLVIELLMLLLAYPECVMNLFKKVAKNSK